MDPNSITSAQPGGTLNFPVFQNDMAQFSQLLGKVRILVLEVIALVHS